MKQIFLVRHCEATGQLPDSQLTPKGFEQVSELTIFLQKFEIKQVITSPFTRTIQTIEPFCQKQNLLLEIDERLIERNLGLGIVDDWLDKYKATFEDIDIKYGEGESSHEALTRILNVIEETKTTTLLVTHGNLLSLVLMHYNKGDGFKYWKQLSNPDVFLLNLNDKDHKLKRLWNTNYI